MDGAFGSDGCRNRDWPNSGCASPIQSLAQKISQRSCSGLRERTAQYADDRFPQSAIFSCLPSVVPFRPSLGDGIGGLRLGRVLRLRQIWPAIGPLVGAPLHNVSRDDASTIARAFKVYSDNLGKRVGYRVIQPSVSTIDPWEESPATLFLKSIAP